MATTPLGLVIPDKYDPVTPVASIAELGLSIDAYLTPQYATVVPAPSPYSGALNFTRELSQVTLQGGVRPGGAAPSAPNWVNIGTVPSGMVPVTEVVMPGAKEPRSGVEYELRIDPNGTIQFRHYVTGTSNTLAINLAWSTAVGA